MKRLIKDESDNYVMEPADKTIEVNKINSLFNELLAYFIN